MITVRLVQEGSEAAQEGPRSLSELHPIVLPPEVSGAPLAPGWTVLAIAVSCLALVFVAWCVARYRALAFRRAALLELAQLRAGGRAGEVSALLKRAALARYPRADVAGTSGAEWWSFLDRTGGARRFGVGPTAVGDRPGVERHAGALLADATYARCALPEEDLRRLFDAAEAWIRAQPPTETLR